MAHSNNNLQDAAADFDEKDYFDPLCRNHSRWLQENLTTLEKQPQTLQNLILRPRSTLGGRRRVRAAMMKDDSVRRLLNGVALLVGEILMGRLTDWPGFVLCQFFDRTMQLHTISFLQDDVRPSDETATTNTAQNNNEEAMDHSHNDDENNSAAQRQAEEDEENEDIFAIQNTHRLVQCLSELQNLEHLSFKIPCQASWEIIIQAVPNMPALRTMEVSLKNRRRRQHRILPSDLARLFRSKSLLQLKLQDILVLEGDDTNDQDLSNNHEGLLDLCHALEGTSLQKLEFDNVQFPLAMWQQLGKSIAASKGVKSLRLCEFDLPVDDFDTMLHTLQGNKVLQSLLIEPVDELKKYIERRNGVTQLEEMIRNNVSLTSFSVNSEKVDKHPRIQFWLRLNQAGRGRFRHPLTARADKVDVMSRVSDDLDSLFELLVDGPTIVREEGSQITLSRKRPDSPVCLQASQKARIDKPAHSSMNMQI